MARITTNFALSLFLLLAVFLSPSAHTAAAAAGVLRLPFLSRSEGCPVELKPHPPVSRILVEQGTGTDSDFFSQLDYATSHALSSSTSSSSSASAARIKGGDFSDKKLAKYMATISNTSDFCTAAVIAPRVIITAAYCAVNFGDHVLVGDTFGLKGVNISIARVITDPRYDGNGIGSLAIAVAILSEPVPDGTPFMKVSISTSLPRTGSYVRVAGYGRFVNVKGSNTDSRLHQVDIPVYDGAECNEALDNVDSQTQFCAGYQRKGNCDVCAGDGGAPVFQYDEDETPVVVGVVVGVRCGNGEHPYPFTRTAGFREQLEQAGLKEGKELVTEADGSGESNGVSTGVIVGAAVAGVVVVVAIIGGIVFWARRPTNVEVFHPEDGNE